MDSSVIFSQNMTPKQGLAQFTPKSDSILEKVPNFLKMAVFDTVNVIPEFPFLLKKYVFLVKHAYSIILDCPLGF